MLAFAPRSASEYALTSSVVTTRLRLLLFAGSMTTSSAWYSVVPSSSVMLTSYRSIGRPLSCACSTVSESDVSVASFTEHPTAGGASGAAGCVQSHASSDQSDQPSALRARSVAL